MRRGSWFLNCTTLVRGVGWAALLLLWASRGSAQTKEFPVLTIANTRVEVKSEAGTGVLPVFVSQNWSQPLPTIRRVVLIVHGISRTPGSSWTAGQMAMRLAGSYGDGTLLIAPQFLTPVDIAANNLPNTILHWKITAWPGGAPAEGPAPLSSFEALDAIVDRLADRKTFPGLTDVVLAGHSAGAQLIQRYAVAGHATDALTRAGIHVRYVVANPSAYVYFSADRPVASIVCPKVNRWRYGFDDAPPYVLKSGSVEQLERTYVSRDVIYLLGLADNDPNHRELDKTCAAEAEGATRLDRGRAYFAYLQRRHPQDLKQRSWEVPGIAHDPRGMFTSACGLTALFDKPGSGSPQ